MKHNNQSKRKFLALFLSTIMICSTGAALASCSDTDSSSSSSSSSTTTKVDNGVIKNAGFENIYESTAGGTITSHCGENVLGILYINDGNN